MSDHSQQPRFWNCSVGVLIAIVISIVIGLWIFFGEALLAAFFNIFLLLPDQVGIIDRLGKDDIVELSVPTEQAIELRRAGTQNVYIVENQPRTYLVTVSTQATGEPIELRHVAYSPIAEPDVHYSLGAPYIPLFEFDIEVPGTYNVSVRYQGVPRGPEYQVTIAPSIPPNSDVVLILSIGTQILVLVLVGGAIYYRLNKARIQATRETQKGKRTKFDDWID